MLAKSKKNELTYAEELRAKDVCARLLASGSFTDTEKKMLRITTASEAQTLKKHVDKALKLFEDSPYRCKLSPEEQELSRYCIRHHDDGKIDELNQRRLNNLSVDQVIEPHGHLSVLLLKYEDFKKECPNCSYEDFRIALTVIYNHHDRLSERSPKEIVAYAEKYLLPNARKYLNDPAMVLQADNLPRLYYTTETKANTKFQDVYPKYQKIKGILNMFDYMASADIDILEMPSSSDRKRLLDAIHNRYPKLRPAQEYMMENHDKNIIVVASTGSGKGEGAMLWANGEIFFFTLSNKSATNEMYRRIHDIYNYKDVKVLHSGALDIYMKEAGNESIDAYETLEAVSLLTAPATVCTADQVFKFAFKAPGTERFAAVLSCSKVIVDELQSYDPKTVANIIFALVQVVKAGGKFCIMTATLPRFFVDRLRRELRREGLEDQMPEVKYFSDSPGTKKHRHKIKLAKDFDINKIVKESATKKVLVTCNTVRKALELYDSLHNAGAFCLHSRFLPPDRTLLERKIMAFSAGEESGIWITTQITETSLDIDFDILYTEASTIDSLIQRMGRVFRAGNREPNEPNIIIVLPKRFTPYDGKICERTFDVLKRYENKLLSEEDKLAMVDYVFDPNALKISDYMNNFNDRCTELQNALPNQFTHNEANQLFRGIENNMSVIPDSVYTENKKLIEMLLEALRTKGLSRGAKRLIRSKLQGMTISVSKNAYGNKCIDEVWKGTWRTTARYDFDKNAERGRGLLLE